MHSDNDTVYTKTEWKRVFTNSGLTHYHPAYHYNCCDIRIVNLFQYYKEAKLELTHWFSSNCFSHSSCFSCSSLSRLASCIRQ